MSTLLLVIALVVAALNLMLPVALLSWGLAGGDGRPDNPFYGGLALVIVLGGVYSLVECLAAFGGVGQLRWWLMWVLPVAAAVGCFLPMRAGSPRLLERVRALWMPAAMAVPPALLWFAGAVTSG